MSVSPDPRDSRTLHDNPSGIGDTTGVADDSAEGDKAYEHRYTSGLRGFCGSACCGLVEDRGSTANGRRFRPKPFACVASHEPRQGSDRRRARGRSEEHTSELQSHSELVCRLLLEKKNGRELATA